MPKLWEMFAELKAGRHIAREVHAAEGSSFFLEEDGMLTYRLGERVGGGRDSDGVLYIDDLEATDWRVVEPRGEGKS